jgi:hypothetical protein
MINWICHQQEYDQKYACYSKLSRVICRSNQSKCANFINIWSLQITQELSAMGGERVVAM